MLGLVLLSVDGTGWFSGGLMQESLQFHAMQCLQERGPWGRGLVILREGGWVERRGGGQAGRSWLAA